MSWAPSNAGGVTVFRVVVHNAEVLDPSPDLGVTVGATFDQHFVDAHPFVTALRHVHVWAYIGRDEISARQAQPRLHAMGATPLPVRDLRLQRDGSVVTGRWESSPGLARVDVLRVPVSVADMDQAFLGRHKIDAQHITPGGFEDPEAAPGHSYEYRVYAVAEVAPGTTAMSPFLARRVHMPADVRPVNDLEAELVATHEAEAEPTFQVRWSKPPQGRVEIYRAPSSPPPGIEAAGIVSREGVTREGSTLVADYRLDRETVDQDGAVVMAGIGWPAGWATVHFTPVTVVDDENVCVGRSVTHARVMPVTHVRLIERVDQQFLTFAWPAGATSVRIFQGAHRGELMNPGDAVPTVELTQQQYDAQGGAHLPQVLPAHGCRLHVVGTTFWKGRTIYSGTTSVDYAGITRIYYGTRRIEEESKWRKPGSVRYPLMVKVDRSIDGIELVLRHHPDRLPLHPRDGQEVFRTRISLEEGVERVLMDDLRSQLSGRPGYVRLLAEVGRDEADSYAVIDPPSTPCEVTRDESGRGV